MRIRLCFFILSLISFSGCSQNKQPARLIVRGDDMGYSHAGNEALIRAFKEGIETSIEVIVPSPWFPEAVKMLQENPNVDVGIHLAITSEWDNVKWRPLSACPSIRDADGYFFPMIRPNQNYPGQAIMEQDWNLQDIEMEFRAQIELGLKKIPRISHISGHMGCTNFDRAVEALTRRLAVEYKIDIDPQAYGVLRMDYDGPHKTAAEKIESFTRALGKLDNGKTYVFVDHPGLDSPELQAIHHVGYEDVAEDRQGVTTLWTSEEVKKAIAQRGIRLISYKELKNN